MKSYGFFMQGSSHTGNKSDKYSTWNFWCTSEGLWCVCSPDRNPREFYSCGFNVKCCVIILSIEKWKKVSSMKFPLYQEGSVVKCLEIFSQDVGSASKQVSILGLFFEVMQVML
jgi:hypothetical protein